MNRTLLREEGDDEVENRQDKKKKEKEKFQDAEKKKKVASKKSEAKKDAYHNPAVAASTRMQPVAGMADAAAVNPDAESLTSPTDTPVMSVTMPSGAKGYQGNVVIPPPPRPVTLQHMAHQHQQQQQQLRGNWPRQQQIVFMAPHHHQVQLQNPPVPHPQYVTTPFQPVAIPVQQVQGQFVSHPHQQGHFAVAQYGQVVAAPPVQGMMHSVQGVPTQQHTALVRTQSGSAQASTQGEQVQGSQQSWSQQPSASQPSTHSTETSWSSNSVQANEGRTWREGAIPINSSTRRAGSQSQWAAFSPVEPPGEVAWVDEVDEEHSSSDEDVERSSSPELMGEEGEVLLRAPSLASFAESISSLEEETEDAVWRILPEQHDYYTKQFKRLQPIEKGVVKGHKARDFFMKSSLPAEVLSKIWHLSDLDKDNALNLDEFCIAMHLVVALRHGLELPMTLPAVLLPAEKPSEVTQPLEVEPDITKQTAQDEEPEPRKVVSPEHWLHFRDSPTPDADSQPAILSSSHTKRKANLVFQPTPVRPQEHRRSDDTPRQASLSDPSSQEDFTESHTAHTKSVEPAHVVMPQSHAQPTEAVPTSPNQAVTAEIARPRATVKPSLLDALPGQLLPPPSGKHAREGLTPTSKVIYQREVMSPEPLSSPLSSPTPEASPDSSEDERKTPSPPLKMPEEEEGEPHPGDEDGKEEVVYRTNRRSGERPRSTGDVKSGPPSDAGSPTSPQDEGSHGSASSEGRREPPPPPPRNKKGHSRSSSLDLNKLFAAKAKENKGSPSASPSSSHSSQNSDGVSPAKSEPTTPRRTGETTKESSTDGQEDGKPQKQENFADFSIFDRVEETRESAHQAVEKRDSSSQFKRNHRRSFSLDHGREAIWSQQSQNVPVEAPTASSRPTHNNEALPRPVPKLKPPSPPTLKQGRKSDKDGEKERKLKTEPPKVIVRPLTKEDKLNTRIHDLKDKNTALSRVNSELQQELKTVMERRVSLEVKLEQLKSSAAQ